MLNTVDAMATIAVLDITAAKKFYEGALGLKAVESQGPTVVTYQSGATRLVVYESQFAGTNKATSVTWIVGKDIDAIVRDLRGKGIAFEHYDFPETKREGDIHIAGSLRLAWLKDPSGNILALIGG
jgi:catechol 2,3-dioxygenase-like lactoylglutathione lyase family enzyme